MLKNPNTSFLNRLNVHASTDTINLGMQVKDLLEIYIDPNIYFAYMKSS